MDDMISRQAAIDALEKARANVGHNMERAVGAAFIEILDDVGEDIGRLPSAKFATDTNVGIKLGTNLAEVGKDLISRQLMDLQSEQQEKQHGRIFQEIVVEYPSISTYLEYKGKPYFSIKYTENGQEFIGYGTYSPEVLSGYLKEYFMPPAEPKIIRCKDCQDYQTDWNPNGATGRHYCATMDSFMLPDGFCSYAERREQDG